MSPPGARTTSTFLNPLLGASLGPGAAARPGKTLPNHTPSLPRRAQQRGFFSPRSSHDPLPPPRPLLAPLFPFWGSGAQGHGHAWASPSPLHRLGGGAQPRLPAVPGCSRVAPSPLSPPPSGLARLGSDNGRGKSFVGGWGGSSRSPPPFLSGAVPVLKRGKRGWGGCCTVPPDKRGVLAKKGGPGRKGGCWPKRGGPGQKRGCWS